MVKGGVVSLIRFTLSHPITTQHNGFTNTMVYHVTSQSLQVQYKPILHESPDLPQAIQGCTAPRLNLPFVSQVDLPVPSRRTLRDRARKLALVAEPSLGCCGFCRAAEIALSDCVDVRLCRDLHDESDLRAMIVGEAAGRPAQVGRVERV